MGTPSRALLTAMLTALLAASSFVSHGALIAVITVGVIALAFGWPILVGLPSPRGASVVIGVTGVTGVTAVALTGSVWALVAVLALTVIAAFVNELARRDGRPRLVESVSGVVTGAVVVVSASGWVGLGATPEQQGLVLCASATLGVAALATAIPVDARMMRAAAIVVPAGVGALVGHLLPDVGLVPGAVVGLGAGLVTTAVHVLFDRFPTSVRPLASFAIAVLPVAVAGVPVFIVGRVLEG